MNKFNISIEQVSNGYVVRAKDQFKDDIIDPTFCADRAAILVQVERIIAEQIGE